MVTKIGTNANETLTGTNGVDSLDGGGGNDTLRGLGGKDLLRGGLGNDALYGGSGVDTASWSLAHHGVSASLIFENADEFGGGGDSLTGIENLIGSNYDDDLTGNGGVNVLVGRGGSDYIEAGASNDTVYGGSGNDYIAGGYGNDVLAGGAGADEFRYFSVSSNDEYNLADGGNDLIVDFVKGTDDWFAYLGADPITEQGGFNLSGAALDTNHDHKVGAGDKHVYVHDVVYKGVHQQSLAIDLAGIAHDHPSASPGPDLGTVNFYHVTSLGYGDFA